MQPHGPMLSPRRAPLAPRDPPPTACAITAADRHSPKVRAIGHGVRVRSAGLADVLTRVVATACGGAHPAPTIDRSEVRAIAIGSPGSNRVTDWSPELPGWSQALTSRFDVLATTYRRSHTPRASEYRSPLYHVHNCCGLWGSPRARSGSLRGCGEPGACSRRPRRHASFRWVFGTYRAARRV
jgi:hypothetical protein